MIKRLVRILGKTFLILLIFSVTAHSQTNGSHIAAGYFRNPLNIPLEIVANMGELRPNHWHMGLDIRTNQKENQPVHAAAAGYIAHIGIRPQSFGRFIVINHPNGLSTLYAHLNDFFPALEEYVTAQQYKQESWAIELDLSKDKFPLSKGQLIAYSGNTGGSQGPHLHFEIFDTKSTKRLNPLLFGFPLKDEVAPNLVKLALYDRQRSIYEQSPVFYSLKNTDSGYIIPKAAVIRTGTKKLSFALQAYDRITGSANADGIFSAEIFVDERPYIRFVIDSISYTGTGYMNAHIDYKYRYNGGAFLQHLSRMPGDIGGVYQPVYNDGIIELNDTVVHAIRIEIRDAYKNISQLNFNLQYDENLAKYSASLATQQLLPNEVSVIEKADLEVYIPETCLYDTVLASYYRNPDMPANAVPAAHQLNDQSIPVHDEITVRIKAIKPILPEWKDRLVIQRRGRNTDNRKAEQQGDWLAGKFGDFGTFQVFADLVPPSFNSIGNGDTVNLSAASRILFTPTDNFGIRKFRVELNGEWLRFTNDKGRNWIYKFDERCPYGTHHLKVIAEDIVGNSTVKEWWFKRGPYTPPKKKAVKKKALRKKRQQKRNDNKALGQPKFFFMITLKEGDKAPLFTSRDQNGNTVSLNDFKGKKLVLFFYSEAGSPTCTIESCNLRDNYALLKKNGFEVVGVSPDTIEVQKKFETKYKLPFPLLADTSHDILGKYGVWDQKKLFGREYMGVLRTTFVIDEKGTISKIFTKPKNKAHAEEILGK